MPNEQQPYGFDYHFRGERIRIRPLFDELLEKLKNLNFNLKFGKAYIGLMHTLVFAALRIQTKKIIVEFVARKRFTSPRKIRIQECRTNS